MNYKLFIPLLLLILLSPVALADYNWTKTYCKDNTTQVIEKGTWNGTENITNSKEYRDLYWGCSEGAEVKPEGSMKGGILLGIISIGLIIGSILSYSVLPKDKHSALKLAFLIMSLILGVFLLFSVSGMLIPYDHVSSIGLMTSTLNTLGYAWVLFTSFIILYFLVEVIMSVTDWVAGGKMTETSYDTLKHED